MIPAQGDTIDFRILSLSGWDIKTSAEEWIYFTPSSSETGNADPIKTTAVISPNYDGYERNAEIRFIPRNSAYKEVSVSLVQRGYDLTFWLSSNEGTDVVMESGGSLEIGLDSRFDWHAEAPDWISVNPEKGSKSTGPRTIILNVSPNNTNGNRTEFVTIYPDVTSFAGGIELDSERLSIVPVRFGVT